jgi:hypothetical protein
MSCLLKRNKTYVKIMSNFHFSINFVIILINFGVANPAINWHKKKEILASSNANRLDSTKTIILIFDPEQTNLFYIKTTLNWCMSFIIINLFVIAPTITDFKEVRVILKIIPFYKVW